jgi:hypothetical protein
MAPPRTSVTARKAHQFFMVALIAAEASWRSTWLGAGCARGASHALAASGGHRFRGQFVWRVAGPAGWLRASSAPNHATRRVARVMGSTIWLLSAAAAAG